MLRLTITTLQLLDPRLELAETDGKEIPVFWVSSDGKEKGWVYFGLGRHTEMGLGIAVW